MIAGHLEEPERSIGDSRGYTAEEDESVEHIVSLEQVKQRADLMGRCS